ncbi:MAG: SURF1 family protein [Actinomycetota bacterium]|nr:SURF1 family protein [Actinomycetota bacterium]
MTRRRLPRLLAPKIVGLTLLAAVLTAAMTVAGIWQLEAYNDSQALDAAQTARAEPVPLDRLLRPDQAFTAEAHARPVVVRGRYAGPQLLVDRGDDRPWLVTPLVTDSGAAVLVVRGLAPADELPAAPDGRVRLVGSLQPSEARGSDGDLSDNRVPTLSTAQLIGDFEQDLYSGFVVLTEQQPPSALPEAPPPQPGASFSAGLRNLMYALQWWVFGGFVIFVWWRMLREESQVA